MKLKKEEPTDSSFFRVFQLLSVSCYGGVHNRVNVFADFHLGFLFKVDGNMLSDENKHWIFL